MASLCESACSLCAVIFLRRYRYRVALRERSEDSLIPAVRCLRQHFHPSSSIFACGHPSLEIAPPAFVERREHVLLIREGLHLLCGFHAFNAAAL